MAHTAPSSRHSDRAAQWIALAPAPPIEQLHELASLLADSGANSEQKINFEITNETLQKINDGKEQELCALIFNMVPFRDLAMMANCLRRGPGQLRRASWRAFCTAHKQKNPDPFFAEPLMLLQFLCWTITHAPEHFLTSKGKTPIMKAATCLSKRVMAAKLAAPEVDSDNSGDHDHTPPVPNSDNEESAKQLQFRSPTPCGCSVPSAVTKKRWADITDDDDDDASTSAESGACDCDISDSDTVNSDNSPKFKSGVFEDMLGRSPGAKKRWADMSDDDDDDDMM